MRLGADGIRRQDLRAPMITREGELILFSYDLGIIRSNDVFLAALASGKPTTFEDQYMRIAPRFEVGADQYAWLMQNLFVGRGRLTGPKAISYDVYRVL
jgi:Protein of unknown function (DUF3237)